MSDIVNYVQQALDGDAVNQIGNRIGADPQATEAGIRASLPVLMGAIVRNASSVRGARSLHDAVRRDHDGSILDGFSSKVGGLDLGSGEAILKHVFGQNQGNVETALGAKSGVGGIKWGELLKLLAPLVLGAISKKMQQGKVSPGGLRKEMRRGERDARKNFPDLGSMVDDVLGAGKDGQGKPMGGCMPMGGGGR